MDFNKLSNRDKREFEQWAQMHQVKQVIQMYTNLSSQCFSDCVNDFSSGNLSSKESTCVNNCVSKFMKANARLSQTFAEQSEMIYSE